MTDSAVKFIARAKEAIADTHLQSAMAKAGGGFVARRQAAIDAEPDFELMRDQAQAVRKKSLADLDIYLAMFERQVQQAGGQVHWAATPEDLNQIVIDICHKARAKTVAKGKSMVGEEAHLNKALEQNGLTPWETDLGEYILQLADEPPSHIVAPALHKTKAQIEQLFRHAHLLGERDLTEVKAIVDEARAVIRERFLSADVGITGANMLIAETGTAVLVTNEGNGDLSACLPRTHIITTTFDRVLPTWSDASKIIRVLARSATGQPITSYTSFFSGPKASQDEDGPEAFHVVLLDNKRSEMIGNEYREMLHCIRCGACMNHCPVYQSVGGHTYNSVYPGPMGAVLTPILRGHKGDYELPIASTFCGRCEEVCPVRIPLPGLMRQLRAKQRRENATGVVQKSLLKGFSWAASKPQYYRWGTGLGVALMKSLSGRKGRLKNLPGAKGWMQFRDLPAPEGDTFQARWRKQKNSQG